MAKVLSKVRLEFVVSQEADFTVLSSLLRSVSPMYPDFRAWLNFTFRRGLVTGNRKICVAYYANQVAGVALLKREESESKICTFYVVPSFREMGIGSRLLDLAIETLSGPRAFITVAEERRFELEPLLHSRRFVLIDAVDSLYRKGVTEYYYSR